jgi:hypothetical protein
MTPAHETAAMKPALAAFAAKTEIVTAASSSQGARSPMPAFLKEPAEKSFLLRQLGGDAVKIAIRSG